MGSALTIDRLQFAFTVTFHYIFPQITMGLALLILILKTRVLRAGQDRYNRAARFWLRVFGISFALGVVTGIPMEFQFGTNWAEFSRAAGGVIGQTLAMEGVFAFFLESGSLGLLLFGEKRLSPRAHWASSLALFFGSWLSGYFIIATNAWMQHPVAYRMAAGGQFGLASIFGLLGNPWVWWEYAHNMIGAVITASVLMAAVGAFYLLSSREQEQAKLFVRVGVTAGLIAALLMAFPTGDGQSKMVAANQPATFAAMEGLFHSQAGAPIAILGQPDMSRRRLDNPLTIPRVLSFLTYRRWAAQVNGLDKIPEARWPDDVPLVYYSYHVMVGLGTIFIAVLAVAGFLLWRGRLFDSRPMLWTLMLALPFPFIANTAGWVTAEAGRQPWLIYSLMRTGAGYSTQVSSGNAVFTFVGFLGLYALLSLLFLFLMWREIERGPEAP
ncbi:MAG TPA: cytochrome ubiquinol oxidase subunit I [Candidatus Dormibacteraeota bacterium]|nr:cytochrome ubiquinol oxidase subunit I [Candidatus Dormibacteraeota bacterium]